MTLKHYPSRFSWRFCSLHAACTCDECQRTSLHAERESAEAITEEFTRMPGRGTMVQISFHSNQEDKRSNTALSHFISAVMTGCVNTLFPQCTWVWRHLVFYCSLIVRLQFKSSLTAPCRQREGLHCK